MSGPESGDAGDPGEDPDRFAGGPEGPPQVVALWPWLDRHTRPAWEPVREDREGDPHANKHGGRTAAGDGRPWPLCPRCGAATELLAQLDTRALPAGSPVAPGAGFLQLFHCPTDYGPDGWLGVEDAGCLPPGGTGFGYSLCRFVAAADAGTIVRPDVPDAPPGGGFRPATITGWDRFDEPPDPAAAWALGLEIDIMNVEADGDEIRCGEVGFRDRGDAAIRAVMGALGGWGGDKLGGWPHWPQDVDHPPCPACGRPTRPVFQFGSRELGGWLPGLIGNDGGGGVGYFQQCPDHPDGLAFNHQCG